MAQILILALVLVTLFLLFQYRRVLNEVKRMTRTTEAIRQGNLNLRYRLRVSQKSVQDLGGELNRLIDHVQAGRERTRFLEDERKRMIANISHDLRTPLTSLLGYIEALQQDATLTAEEKDNFIKIAAGKGNTLLERLQEFFELARLEAEDTPPELHKINLNDVVQEVLVGFYPDFQKISVAPTVQLPASPPYVRGDRIFLRRVFENLLSNALRYGREGGEIGIEVREDPDSVRVEIWDRGQGISSQDLPHVFDRFYTGEASRNAALRGTGLGLTIAKSLVEKQGGRIAVSSKPGEKTVFSVSLLKG
ncbi:sensor histidine kinase [Paenibacillus sp. HJGM_3]|uniref:sensor histidine kinase n=1 Tax=Paenibacillus sp. HJGM_3 TaxID=3379816 RepID=UPI00385D814C